MKANNYLGGISTFILTSNITILDNDLYLHLNAPGVNQTYYQWGLNGSVPPNSDVLDIVNCGLSDGKVGIAAGLTSSQGAMTRSFSMVFGSTQPGTYVMFGSNCPDGDDEATYSENPQSGYAYTLNYYTRHMQNDVCYSENECADFIAKITAYDEDTQIIKGYFSGSLYYDPPDAWDNCSSSEEISVSGTFRLKLLF
jgi:hypothetical protein